MLPVNQGTATQFQLTSGQANPPAGFSTDSCFSWLHDKNVALSANIRGEVNYEYNHMLTEKGLFSGLIPGKDLEQLGKDRTTCIVRPDFYLDACYKVMMSSSAYSHSHALAFGTTDPFHGLNLCTDTFFDLLHKHNVDHSKNVRGLVNERYNNLLVESGFSNRKIPGNNLEQLGLDRGTLLKLDLYAKAYRQVIARFEPSTDPFSTVELFVFSACFMERYTDIFNCARVCKSWNKFSEHLSLWQQLSSKEKIPMVERLEGHESNPKQEFRTLYPITISGRMSEGLMGPFCGEIPLISRKCFENCFRKDPFESEKLMKDTFNFVVIPGAFKRESCAEFPFILDENGDLKETNSTGLTTQTLEIRNRIKNLQTLCKYPLNKERKFVFECIEPEILEQCNTCPNKISLIFMRIRGVSGGMNYSKQKAYVEEQGFEVTSLRNRLFFFGAYMSVWSPQKEMSVCSLGKEFFQDFTNSRTSDAVLLREQSHRPLIEWGNNSNTISIHMLLDTQSRRYASFHPVPVNIVPCISAEVQKPFLQDLGIISKEHYSAKLGCAPDHLQKIGILTLADLEVLGIHPCPLAHLPKPQAIAGQADDFRKLQEEAFEKKDAVVSCLETLAQEVKTKSESSALHMDTAPLPWKLLQDKINVAYTNLCERCKTPKALLSTFETESHQLIIDEVNALIDEFNALNCEYQVLKLHAYVSQWGVLKAWQNLQTQGIVCLADLIQQHPETSPDFLFRMGE